MKVRAAIRGLLACLLLVGCSLGRGTRPVVKIGLIAPFEGRYRSLGYEVLYAVKLAVRERNAAGGVAGHMVELVALDDGGDPHASAVQADKLAVDGQVMGAIGPFSEAAVRAAAPVYQEAALAALAPVTCATDWRTSSQAQTVFCTGADASTLARAMADRLPDDARATLLRAGEEALGDSLLPTAGRALEAPWDMAALREQPADVLLFDGPVLDAVGFLIQARQAGIDAPLWGGPALARTQLAQIAGDAVVGTCTALPAPRWADPGAASVFAAGYRALSGMAPGPWAALAYEATVLLLGGLERAIDADRRPTREGIVAALDAATGHSGEPVFDRGQRRETEVVLYCYRPGDAYPGTLRP